MTPTEWLEAAGFIVLIVLAFVATGLHRGIKGKQDDNDTHW
ncbi:putative membrane protein [Burkholderia gladioli]|uniref:Membrane protein n=1 Tax=Burkholderia gladioli TaxID=28095 RepID=A0AAW3F2M3_BURGA|nr:hypothetical protein [Burkholderia gladioli]KGC14001.1 putative membrane protein [Burkholderia gladioli]